MAGDDAVKLLGFWASPYTLRVHWALKLKGVEYEYVEEDLMLKNKSLMLQQYNPVHKKVPVLVHKGNPIVESLVILEYIDETWKQNPLLPDDDLYERSQLRFWAKFADEKCVPSVFSTFSSRGEELEQRVGEARENLRILESAIAHRKRGDKVVGFLDVAVAWVALWAEITGDIIGMDLVVAREMPCLATWFDDVFELAPVLRECSPPKHKLLEFNAGFRKMLLSNNA